MKNFCLLALPLFFSMPAFSSIAPQFEMSREVAAVNVDVKFVSKANSPIGNTLKYFWDFGDGNKIESFESSVAHRYQRPGAYLIRLRVQDGRGENGEVSKGIKVVSSNPPSSEFYVNRLKFDVDEKVAFISQAKDERGVEKEEWLINDAFLTSGKYWVHQFKEEGIFKITHRVTNIVGEVSETSKEVSVRKRNVLPKVEIDIEYRQLYVGETAKFSATASDEDGRVVKYFWKISYLQPAPFKEGENIISHKFYSEGKHLVELEVIDDRGGKTRVSKEIFVDKREGEVKPELKILGERHFAGKDVLFKLSLKGSKSRPIRISWNFGDSSTERSSRRIVKHKYANPGKYLVKVTLELENGKNVEVETEVKIEMSSNAKVIGPIVEAVIQKSSYFELTPTQSESLWFRAYDINGYNQTWGTNVNWVVSGNSITTSTYGSTLNIKGNSAGSSFIYVVVDGIVSQTIEVNVQPFVNGISVAKANRVLGAFENHFDVEIDRASQSGIYDFTIQYNEPFFRTNYGTGFDNIGRNLRVHLPSNKTEAVFKATKIDQSETLSYTKQNLKAFYGKEGYLKYANANGFGQHRLLFSEFDKTLMNLESDFSLSFWYYVTEDSNFVFTMSGLYWIRITPDQINNSEKTLRYFSDSNDWVHITLTVDSATKTYALYINGDYIGSIPAESNPDGSIHEFKIIPSSPSYGAVGLDELKFWNKKLSSSEVLNEAFNPSSHEDSRLLASFGLDSTLNNEVWGEKGNWLIKLTEIGTVAGSPEIAKERDTLSIVTQPLEDNYFKTSLGWGIGNDELSLSVPVGALGQSTHSLLIDHGDCEKLQVQAISGVIIEPRQQDCIRLYDVAPPSKPVEVRLPLDSTDLAYESLKNIKVILYRPYVSGTSTHYILEPLEVNITQGYVSFHLLASGTYAIGYFPWAYTEKYSNQDLKRGLFNYWGFKSYYATISSASSTYQINFNEPFYGYIHSVVCNGVSQSDLTPPLVITGLSEPDNACWINYGNYNNSVSYYESVIISKQ